MLDQNKLYYYHSIKNPCEATLMGSTVQKLKMSGAKWHSDDVLI